MTKTQAIRALTQIPGVGLPIAADLYQIGIRSVEDLKSRDPEQLYDLFNRLAGYEQDKWVLYVLRCAVYYAKTPEEQRDNRKLKWWNWKDEALDRQQE